MAYLLIILAVLASLCEGMLIKKYNKKHEHGGFIFTSFVSFAAMLYFLITDTGGLCFPREIFPYAIVSGLMYCLASFLTYVALSCGSYSMSMLVLSYSIVFSISFGIFYMKEAVSVFSVIGFVLLAVSLFLTRNKVTDSRFSIKWLISISLSVFGAGMFSIVMRLQQIRFDNKYNNEFMVVSLAVSFVLLFVWGFIKDKEHLKEIFKYGAPFALVSGITNGFANMMSMIIVTLIPISLYSPLSSGVKIIISF